MAIHFRAYAFTSRNSQRIAKSQTLEIKFENLCSERIAASGHGFHHGFKHDSKISQSSVGYATNKTHLKTLSEVPFDDTNYTCTPTRLLQTVLLIMHCKDIVQESIDCSLVHHEALNVKSFFSTFESGCQRLGRPAGLPDPAAHRANALQFPCCSPNAHPETGLPPRFHGAHPHHSRQQKGLPEALRSAELLPGATLHSSSLNGFPELRLRAIDGLSPALSAPLSASFLAAEQAGLSEPPSSSSAMGCSVGKISAGALEYAWRPGGLSTDMVRLATESARGPPGVPPPVRCRCLFWPLEKPAGSSP